MALPSEQAAVDGGLYLPNRSARPYFSTGCYMVDLLLGNGYCEGQIIKLRGESQAGKSLFAIEGAANFLHQRKRGRVRYVDRENAFDEAYVEALGIDLKRITRPRELSTVEDVMEDVIEHLEAFSVNRSEKERRAAEASKKKAAKKKAAKKKATKKVAKKKLDICDDPLLYVIDSWDGLTSEAELGRNVHDKATYAMEKSKKGHEFARRVMALAERVPFTLIVVTQNRWKQSAMPGLPPSRSNSGGSWLDYYPTQVLDLATEKWIENTRSGHQRKYGRWLKVMATKNRRSGPQHPVFVPLMFGYGVCDLTACYRYLIEENAWSLLFETREQATRAMGGVWSLAPDAHEDDLALARKHAGEVFEEIATLFSPKRKKYGKPLKTKGK